MQWIQLIKYQKNILSNRINKGFSLLEAVLVITISSIFISSIIFSAFFIHFSLIRAKKDSITLNEMSAFINIISSDILNLDIHPHRPAKDYEFKNNKIVFYSDGNKISYEFKDNILLINKNDKIYKFNFIKKLDIIYYDINGNKVVIDSAKENILPFYCELKLQFKDNKIKSFKMRI